MFPQSRLEALLFFLIFACLIVPKASRLNDIPIESSKDGITIQKDFSSKYRVFSLVGARLNKKLTNYLVSFVKADEKVKANSFCLVAPNKALSSLKRKMDFELNIKHHNNYYYKDFEDIKDFVRSSMIFSSLQDIYKASAQFEKRFGVPSKKDDTFNKTKSPEGKGKTGYRDLSYNFAIQNADFSMQRNKTIGKNNSKAYYLRFEVQLHLCGIFLAKQIGHYIYEITRVLSQIDEKIHFKDIITNENEFEKLFKNIQEILPEKKNEKIGKSFELWKKNKNDLAIIRKFIKKLKKLSLHIYNVSAETDQKVCIKKLRKLINNEKCNFFDGKFDELETISKEFVKDLLK